MPRIAKITDDDLSVDLIDNSNIAAKAGDGFGSTRFDPAAYDAKVPSEDALLFVENWELVARGTDQDGLTDNVRDLIRLLRRAFLYRTDQGYRESHQPVYITMQITDETNPRYAMVWGCRALEHPDLFGTETTYSSLIREFGVNIARYIWRDGVPGTLPPISVLDPTDGPDYSTAELDYEVDLLDHLGRVPSTKTGGILGRPGKFGRGVQIAEATTSLEVNPSFETNTTGWSKGGTNTIARSADQAKYGAYSLKCTYQDDINLAQDGITLTAVAHVLSMWVYVPSDYDGTDLNTHFENFAGATGVVDGEVNMALTDQWQLVVAFATPVGGDLAGHLQILEDGTPPTAGKFIYIDAVQCEAKAYPTPYCDGSLGLGHAWSGAAHASTSTRVAAHLNFDSLAATLVGDVGSIFLWAQGAPAGVQKELFDCSDGTNNNRMMIIQQADNKFDVYVNGGYRVADVGSGDVPDFDTDYFICWTWDFTNDDYNLYIYEDSGTLYTANDSSALTALTGHDEVNIGRSQGDGIFFNGVFDDFVVLSRVISQAEFTALYNSGKAFAGDPDLLLYLNFDGPKRVHVSNFRDSIVLTNIKVEDTDAGPGYTDVEGTVEWTMFPDPIGTNDQLLFGSTDHFPKVIVIPRLSVAGQLTDSDFKVYYWDGGGYTELVLGTDYTCFPGPTLEDCFEQNDHDIVISVNPPNNADQVLIDGDTCDWVIIKEAHAAPVYAVHPVASYEPYTQRTPTVKVPTTALLGDVPPYLLARLHTPAGGDENENFASTSRIIVGSKENPGVFVSRLNLGGDDNPTGWAATDDTDTTFTPQPVSPGGMNAVCTFGGDETMVKRVTLTGTGKLGAWRGEYRVFVLAEQKSGAAGETAIMLRTYLHNADTDGPKYDTRTVVSLGTDQKREVFDLGKLTIPFMRVAGADDLTGATIVFEIHAERTAGAGTLEFSELLLMPVGKWSCELDDPITDSVNGSSALRGTHVLQVDGGVMMLRTGKFVRSGSYLYPIEEWGRGGPPVKVEPETATTLYFLIMHYPAGGTWGEGPFIASPACSFMFELYSHACYEILRGNN